MGSVAGCRRKPTDPMQTKATCPAHRIGNGINLAEACSSVRTGQGKPFLASVRLPGHHRNCSRATNRCDKGRLLQLPRIGPGVDRVEDLARPNNLGCAASHRCPGASEEFPPHRENFRSKLYIEVARHAAATSRVSNSSGSNNAGGAVCVLRC